MKHLSLLPLSLLKSEYVNFLIFKIRFIYFVYFRKNIRVYENEQSVIANKYSVNMLKRGITSNRPLKFILPLSVIEAVNKKGKTLSIGCRFETELWYLAAYGFKKSGIRGMDMVSYSPWIDIGNMHKMPYENSSFDTVTMGWLISYSETPELAAQEVIRILKPGGFVAISVAHYTPEQLKKVLEDKTYVAHPGNRIQNTEGLLKIFGPHVDQVYFRHQPSPDREGACTVVFSIKK